MAFITLIVVLVFFQWFLKSLGLQIPGSHYLSSSAQKWVGKLFDGEKQSGARFLTENETRSFLNNRHSGVVLDGLGRKRLSAQASFEHVAIISPTGAGKTTCYVAPNLLTLNDCSIMVTDPSGELYHKTSGAMAQRGFDVQVLNLEKPAQSLGYNPITNANTHDEINELAFILMRSSAPEVKAGDEIWYSEAQNLLAILIRCLKNTEEPEWMNLHNLLYLLENFGNQGRGLFAFVERYADDLAFSQFKGFISGNEKMIASFTIMARNALQMVSDPAIASMFARDELKFESLRQRKTVLYIVVPSKKLKLYGPLLNLFYTQFFDAQDDLRYSTQGLPIYALLDEFGHAMVPSFDTVATTIRKYRVSLSIILQDYGQLRKQYGDHAAQTIISGSMRTKIFYAGLDTESSSMVEKMLGKVEYEYKKNGHKSWRNSNLMNADRISRMQDNEALCVSSNQEPVLLTTTPCYRNRQLDRLMQFSPHPLPCALPTNNLHYVSLS